MEPTLNPGDSDIAAVVIGRNEGKRLQACLASIPRGVRTVYVDSGSSDNSVDFAKSLQIEVVELDTRIGFTAARARNAGLARLKETGPIPAFVQMIDGDCSLDGGWMACGAETLTKEPDLAVVFGRRRERFPEKSIYNRLCDDEWNVPVGLVNSCGGDALFRVAPLFEANGYEESLIAGEEPDLCLRLRLAGWKIRRVDSEMTLHDAAIIRFSQWWRRARRSGHAYAEHVWRHGKKGEPAWIRQVASIVLWALILPSISLTSLIAGARLPSGPIAVFGLAIACLYPLQWFRIALRRKTDGASWNFATAYAGLMIVGKFAELGGIVRFLGNHWRNRAPALIEYKQVDA